MEFEEGEGEGEGGAADAPDTGADTDTDTDVDGGGETPETPATEGAGDETDDDMLLSFAQDESIQALVADQKAKGARYKLTRAEFDALPIEAKRTFAALVYAGEESQATLAEQQEAARQAKADAATQERKALQARAKSLEWTQDPNLQAFLAALKPKGDEPDPSSPEGIVWQVKKEMSEQFAQFFAGMQKVRTDQDAAAAKAEADAARAAEVAGVQAYMTKHAADFDPASVAFPQIRELYHRTQGGKNPLTVQEAHEIVMARLERDELAKTNQSELERARGRVAKGGTRGKPIPEMPAEIKGDTDAMLEWMAAHPEWVARDIERHERRGTAL